MGWGTDPVVAAPSAPPPAPAAPATSGWGKDPIVLPQMPPEHYPHETVDAPPPAGEFTPIDNRAAAGPAAIGNYLKDWGSQVWDSATGAVPSGNVDPRYPAEVGPGDAALSMASMIPAAIAAPARAGQAIINGEPDTSLGQAFQEHVRQPVSQGGTDIMNTVGALFKPVTDLLGAGGQVLGENAGRLPEPFKASPSTQQDIAWLVDTFVPTLMGAKVGGEALPKAPEPVMGAGAAGDTVARLRSHGFLVSPDIAKAKLALESPDRVQPSVPGTMTSGLVNRGPMNEAFTIENTKVARNLTADEFGLPQGTRPTPQALEAVAKAQNPAYEMVKQALPNLDTAGVQGAFDAIGAARRDNPLLGEIPKVRQFREQLAQAGTVTTQQALDAIREWRADAGRYFNATGGDAVVNEQTARAYRSAADALENEIGTQLDATGNKHVFQQFENARTIQAKVHNALDAWNGEDIDPQALLKLKKQGVKLTGNLEKIADAAENAPDVVRSATGSSLASPSMGYGGHAASAAASEIRRLLFDKWGIPRLMSDKVQNQYGAAAPRTPNTIAPPELPFGNPAVAPQQGFPPPTDSNPMLPGLGEISSGREAVQWNSDPLDAALLNDMAGHADAPRTMPNESMSAIGPDLVSALLSNPNILQSLVEALGVGDAPAGPMNPPRGPRSLKNQRAELNTPTGVARPEEFP